MRRSSSGRETIQARPHNTMWLLGFEQSWTYELFQPSVVQSRIKVGSVDGRIQRLAAVLDCARDVHAFQRENCFIARLEFVIVSEHELNEFLSIYES
jgi:hypothetical protein